MSSSRCVSLTTQICIYYGEMWSHPTTTNIVPRRCCQDCQHKNRRENRARPRGTSACHHVIQISRVVSGVDGNTCCCCRGTVYMHTLIHACMKIYTTTKHNQQTKHTPPHTHTHTPHTSIPDCTTAQFYQCSVPAVDATCGTNTLASAAIAPGFCVQAFNTDLLKPRGIEV